MRPLELIETDALKDELLARCDHGVIALMWVGEMGPGIHSRRTAWRGNPETCQGLAMRVVGDIQERCRHEENRKSTGSDAPQSGDG